MGNILAIIVHAANVHDTKSGREVFLKALWKYPSVIGICADEGYKGTFFIFVTMFLGLICDISEKIVPKGWHVIPKRWRVERTFAWFGNSRRLSKDYEICSVYAENVCIISHLHTLLKRL